MISTIWWISVEVGSLIFFLIAAQFPQSGTESLDKAYMLHRHIQKQRLIENTNVNSLISHIA